VSTVFILPLWDISCKKMALNLKFNPIYFSQRVWFHREMKTNYHIITVTTALRRRQILNIMSGNEWFVMLVSITVPQICQYYWKSFFSCCYLKIIIYTKKKLYLFLRLMLKISGKSDKEWLQQNVLKINGFIWNIYYREIS
jgi:hypothetical protein